MAGVVDALGGEIRHAADWRTHAVRHPLWALGAAAGVGLLAAALVRRRPAPEARLLEAATSSLEALADRDCVLETLHEAGWETRVEVPHWLAKARRGETFVDVIHSSGNGVARVDDLWFTHSVPGQVLGVETRLVPVEEMIWSKAFVMENYRFDGADVAHLLLIQGHRIDWDRLLLRFGRNWRVLLGHLLFFGFIYPEQQNLVPQAFLDTLLALLRREGDEAASTLADPSARAPSCRGTLLSRKQYRVDVEVWGFRDTRLDPDVRMSERDIAEWTLANPDASGVAAEA
jgi:hypothetical protein